MKIRFIIGVLASLLIVSCANRGEIDLEREDLFRLSYGKMEDQLDIIQMPGTPFDTSTKMVMRDGFFYILNRSSGKVMKFNSYGDIVELFYNPAMNPEPVLLEKESGEGDPSTRRAFSYPFEDIRNFTVSPQDIIYVNDRIVESRREYDEENDAMLDRIILRFNRDGRLLDYLGQEGVGGTPFSFIQRMDISRQGELIVTTRNMRGWRVFWFSQESKPLVTLDIPLLTIPIPEGSDYTASLESIIPDPRVRQLYLKVDYYGTESLSGSADNYGYISSAILVLNAETGLYSDSIEIPIHRRESSEPAGFTGKGQIMLYELLGVAEGKNFFLLSPEDGPMYRLLIIDRHGAVISRPRIELADGDLMYRDMNVGFEGILSSVLCLENRVEVVLWRTDRLLQGVEE
ncbi:MAG: hypothetical protein JW760_10430 [Spirochaetales bacterium]|nr:hypothetical protein [Spirochaetales bacterium]